MDDAAMMESLVKLARQASSSTSTSAVAGVAAAGAPGGGGGQQDGVGEIAVALVEALRLQGLDVASDPRLDALANVANVASAATTVLPTPATAQPTSPRAFLPTSTTSPTTPRTSAPASLAAGPSLASLSLVEAALASTLTVSDFPRLRAALDAAFDATSAMDLGGKPASYIPPLAMADPTLKGAACCTVDGQRWSRGDSQKKFTVQSVSKVVNYLVAHDSRGRADVLSKVGAEPSGLRFNEFSTLPGEARPHNPFVNAGAIRVVDLLYPHLDSSARFEMIMDAWRRACAGAAPSFDYAVFLAERDTAYRNMSLAWLLVERGALPPTTDVPKLVSTYLSLCAIEATCESAAVMAATLANWGVDPITKHRVFSEAAVRDCLSVMASSGLYDGSGTFFFHVGLPAKSGVSGVMVVVAPGLAGFATFAPPLDENGNSAFGVAFFRTLTASLDLGLFSPPTSVTVAGASTTTTTTTPANPFRDPRRGLRLLWALLFAAAEGNASRVRELAARGAPINASDWDARTPLHIACSEGRVPVVELLLRLGAHVDVQDRFGSTPLDDAKRRDDVVLVKLLSKARARAATERGRGASSGSEDGPTVSAATVVASPIALIRSLSRHESLDVVARGASASASERRHDPPNEENAPLPLRPTNRTLGAGLVRADGKPPTRRDLARVLRAAGIRDAAAASASSTLNTSFLTSVAAAADAYSSETGSEGLALALDGDDEPVDFAALSSREVRALQGVLAVPDFRRFAREFDAAMDDVRKSVSVPDVSSCARVKYSAPLRRASQHTWEGAAVTVDNQSHVHASGGGMDAALGTPADAAPSSASSSSSSALLETFSLQSCFKPFAYALAVQEFGVDAVHRHVGVEPSGRSYDFVGLSAANVAHNPLVNAGGLTVCALLSTKPGVEERFASAWRRATGCANVAVSEEVLEAELAHADKHRAILLLMRDAGTLPCMEHEGEGDVADVERARQAYFWMCSVQTTVRDAAAAAATLANWGVSPVTNERVFSVEVVRSTLRVMF